MLSLKRAAANVVCMTRIGHLVLFARCRARRALVRSTGNIFGERHAAPCRAFARSLRGPTDLWPACFDRAIVVASAACKQYSQVAQACASDPRAIRAMHHICRNRHGVEWAHTGEQGERDNTCHGRGVHQTSIRWYSVRPLKSIAPGNPTRFL